MTLFGTVKSRLALVLSGAVLLGAFTVAGRPEELGWYSAIGLIAVWGGVYGVDWVIRSPTVAGRSFDLPTWARYAIITALVILVMGLPKVISNLHN